MDKPILKIITLLSIFFGVLAGVIAIIPFIGELAFWLLISVAAPIVIVFLNKNNILEIFTVRQSAVIGAMIGFISFIAFCILYVPITVVLAKFLHYSSNPGVALMLSNASLGIISLLAVFMGILSATINAFSGFVTFFVLEFMKTLNKDNENDNQFNIRK